LSSGEALIKRIGEPPFRPAAKQYPGGTMGLTALVRSSAPASYLAAK
jgi:hypothetical protein